MSMDLISLSFVWLKIQNLIIIHIRFTTDIISKSKKIKTRSEKTLL